jgi:hypothetical protein
MCRTEGEKVESRRARRFTWLGYWWPVLALAGAALLYSGFAGVVWWIQADAHERAARAAQEFPGDEVQALLGLVQSERQTFAERNAAVHALGQIGDRRALPVLRALYTGATCEHSECLSQLELRKAIDRCEGRNWAPSWLPFFPRPPEDSGPG